MASGVALAAVADTAAALTAMASRMLATRLENNDEKEAMKRVDCVSRYMSRAAAIKGRLRKWASHDPLPAPPARGLRCSLAVHTPGHEAKKAARSSEATKIEDPMRSGLSRLSTSDGLPCAWVALPLCDV